MADAFAADPVMADDSTGDCRDNASRQPLAADRAKALKEEYRYFAARCAALAGAGSGNDAADLGSAERTAWRDRAREWLLADFKTWNATPDDPGGVAQQMLVLWQADPDFAAVRDPAAMKKLTQDEREQWSALWNEVGRALRR